MSLETPSLTAAVSGLVRSDPHGPGDHPGAGRGRLPVLRPVRRRDHAAADAQRIRALRIPPAWRTSGSQRIRSGTSRPRAWTARAGPSTSTTRCGESSVTPRNSATCSGSPARCPGSGRRPSTIWAPPLNRDRVSPGRGPADRPRPVPHRRGEVRRARPSLRGHDPGEAARAADARRRDVRLHRQGGKHRTITVNDRLVLPTVRALIHCDNGDEALFCYSTTTAGTGCIPGTWATTSPAGPGATTRPRNSAPGTPPC